MPEVKHFEPDTDPIRVSEHLERWGCAIVDDVADGALLDRLATEVEPFVARSPVGRDSYDGLHTARTGALIARSPAARELVSHPLAIATTRHFLRHATTIQLHLTQLITIGPGESAQKLHRDQMAFDFYPFPPDYHVQCNTMWALSDFTAANGATCLLPGSSGLDDSAASDITPVTADMRRGSVLFYDGKVLHGGGANTTDRARQGVNITYAVGWVRQEENQFLACPREVALTLDDELLRLMGYQQGAFALGYAGDQQDPLAALRGEDVKVRTVAEFAESNESFRRFVDDLDENDGGR